MNNEMILERALPPTFDHLPAFKRWLMSSLAKVHYGKLFIYIDGQCYACGNEVSNTETNDQPLIAVLRIHNPLKMAWNGMTKGDLGFAESYLEGHWSSDDVSKLLLLLLKNWSRLGKEYDNKRSLRITSYLLHKFRKNSVKGSRKNIEYHYDLGNDFYQLWLDESMTYSSALFTDKVTSNIQKENYSLAEAQHNKYQRILDELNVDEGQTILEVGCGWGGFAEVVAEEGCSVHGITLSKEQLGYAQSRLVRFDDKTHLEIKDYRLVDQQYDHIVSIEMFEAVGEQYWQTYFEMLKRSLKPGGRIVLQIITIKDEYFDVYKSRADFIQRYIFPGGMLPPEGKLESLVQDNDLKVVKQIKFGHDYAETLARWEKRFMSVIPELEKLGYDERFQRMWRYYLGYCQAGFEEERINVVQLTLTHAE